MAPMTTPPGRDYTPQQRQPNRAPWAALIIARELGQAVTHARTGIARCRRLCFRAGEGRISAAKRAMQNAPELRGGRLVSERVKKR